NLSSTSAFAHPRLHEILNQVPCLRTAPSGDVIPTHPCLIITIEAARDVIERGIRLRERSVCQRIQIRPPRPDRGATRPFYQGKTRAPWRRRKPGPAVFAPGAIEIDWI